MASAKTGAVHYPLHRLPQAADTPRNTRPASIGISGRLRRNAQALSAIQGLHLELSQRAVRSQLLFPASIESHLRALMADWIEHASVHLAQRHAKLIEAHDERIEAAKDHADDLHNSVVELKTAASFADKQSADLAQQPQALTADRDQARMERNAPRAIAAERQRVIDQLFLGPAAKDQQI